MHFYKTLCTFFVLSILISCKKDKLTPSEDIPVSFFSNGLLVVNEGLFQQNNASLSWVDFNSGNTNNTIFEQKSNRQLGDVGNDIIQYGSKIFIVVSVSSTVEVMDAHTGASIKQISMRNGEIAKQPRFAAKSNGRVFISCFDGFVDVIDTTQLEVIERIPVGANPDELHVSNNQIFVANSGGLSYPNVDSTLSILNPISLVETQRVVVGKNPTRVCSSPDGSIYVITQTGLNSLNNQLVKLHPTTFEIDTIFSWNVMRMTPMNDKLVLNIQNGNTSSIQLFDTHTHTIVSTNFLPASHFTTYYGAQYDNHLDQLYCFDAMSYVNSGFVRVYKGNGTFIKNIQVGLNPSKLLIYE